ncbi:MAG: hypothetical protein GX257_04925 [Clostridiales bacterium]|jgi:hypothetical protein|nr:hypothetical protein [Clostridiales bacterium]
MSEKNNKYHMDKGFDEGLNSLDAFGSDFFDTVSSETVSVDSSELLIDEILREFGSQESRHSQQIDSIDDEVANILKSVRLSLEEEMAETSEGVLDDVESISETPVHRDSGKGSEPFVEKIAVNEALQPPADDGETLENSAPAQKVKVISEGDSSPIFGDDFAKYFGPNAGLAAEIEIFEHEDEIHDDGGKSRTLFRRRRKEKKNKHSLDEGVEYINSDTIDANTSKMDTIVPDLDATSPDFDATGDESPSVGTRRKRWRRSRVAEQDEVSDGELDPDFGTEDFEEISDIDPEEAAKAIIEDMGLIRVKLFFGAILCAVLLYLNIAPRAGLFLPKSLSYVSNPGVYLFICACLLIFIMIMCIKTVAIGIRDFLLLKPNMESVVALSCVLSIAHTISILLMPQWEGYYPYTAVSATSLMFAEYARYKSQTARVRTYKAVSAMSRPYLVSCENSIYSGQDAAVKYRVAEPLYFVHQTERKDMATKVWTYAAPLVIVLSIVCAAVSSIGKGQSHRFIWALSAMMTVAAPFSICLSYSLPFSKTARSLGLMGHAVAGWSAAEEMSSIDSVIISDTDLFPPGSIVLNGLKIYGGYAVDKVISYSASLIAASHSGATKPFLDLLHDQAATQHKVIGFQYYENGGIGGEIGGESVIAGNATFMLRTGIRIPRDVSVKNAIYIAINHELAGIFAVNYNANTGIKKALNMLIKNGLNPVLAIRDFNITPAMLESKFNISSDIADYPPIEDRLSLSNPDRIYTSKPLAAIGREGLTHYAESIVLARNLKRATRISIGITLASIIIGMLLMFYLLYSHSPVQASPFNLLLYMAFWLIPNLIAARWAKM